MANSTHTGRLIAVIILMIITLSVALNGYWLGGVFWGLITLAVAYPFIEHKSLTYPSGQPIVVYTSPGVSAAQ